MIPAAFTFLVVLLTAAAHSGHTPQCTTQHVPFTYTDGTIRDLPITVCQPPAAPPATSPATRTRTDDRHAH